MSEEPDFATFESAPLEAYKTLFEKFLKAKAYSIGNSFPLFKRQIL